MKKTRFITSLLLTMIFVACSNRENSNEDLDNELLISAGMDAQSRTMLQDDAITITWYSGDRIYLFDDEGSSNGIFVLHEGAGETIATFGGNVNGKLEDLNKSLYPIPNNEGSEISYDFPIERVYTDNSAAPMIGDFDSGAKHVQFKNLVALVRVSLAGKDVPHNSTITLTMNGQMINGKAIVDVENEKLIFSGGNNVLTIKNIPSDVAYIDVPVPAGTYSGYTVKLNGENLKTSADEIKLGKDDVLIIGELPASTKPISVSFDVNNPLFASLAIGQDENIYLYTEKDSEGFPIRLKEMIVEMGDGTACEFVLDNNGKPTYMAAPNGLKFYFEWISDFKVATTIIDPTTGDQINVLLDLSEDKVSSKVVSRANSNRNDDLKMEIKPKSILSGYNASITDSRGSTLTSGTIPVIINLRHCNSPADATCYIDVRGVDSYDKYLGRFKGVKVSDGVYEVNIPKSFFPEYENDYLKGEKCDKIIDFLGNICTLKDLNDKIMEKLDDMLIESKALQLLPVLIQIGKQGLKKALITYCKYIDDHLSKHSEFICDGFEKMALYNSSHVILYPKVQAIPYDILGEVRTVDLSLGNISPINITWGGNPSISSFTLNPSAPMAGQSYKAIAELHCIPNFSKVTMSIVGTDGYTNSKTQTISGESLNYTTTLFVPGASQGVYDVCKVVVTTPDGKSYSKTATLIFQ